MSTLAVFICFSGMALVARRRQYFFLGAILSSALTTLLFLQLASMLFGATPLVNNVQVRSPDEIHPPMSHLSQCYEGRWVLNSYFFQL